MSELTLQLLMVFPSLFPVGSDGKRISFILLVMILLLVMTAHAQRRREFTNVIPGVLLLYLSFYEVLRNVVFYGLSSAEWRDLGEIIRIVGVYCAFYLGAHARLSEVSARRIVITFVCVNLLLLIEYTFNLRLLSYFYYDKLTRFSGTSVSINYVFSQIVLGAFLLRNFKMSNSITLVFFLTSLGILGFSGSRTSFLVSVPVLLLLAFSRMNKFILSALVLSSFLLIQRMDFLSLDFDGISRYVKTVEQVAANDFIFHTLDKRIDNLKEIYEYATNNIWFGYGSNKSVYATIDNTYIMTIYRYGLVGLALELLFYLVSFFWSIRKSNDKVFTSFVLMSFLVAGFVSAVSYELRASLIFFYLLGLMLSNSIWRYKKNCIALSEIK